MKGIQRLGVIAAVLFAFSTVVAARENPDTKKANEEEKDAANEEEKAQEDRDKADRDRQKGEAKKNGTGTFLASSILLVSFLATILA